MRGSRDKRIEKGYRTIQTLTFIFKLTHFQIFHINSPSLNAPPHNRVIARVQGNDEGCYRTTILVKHLYPIL